MRREGSLKLQGAICEKGCSLSNLSNVKYRAARLLVLVARGADQLLHTSYQSGGGF
jgi:hypothetical protein